MYLFQTNIPAERADELEDFFFEYDTECPWSLFCDVDRGDQWYLKGYFDDEAAGWTDWAIIRNTFNYLPEKPDVEFLADKDWKDAYKAYLKPWHCGKLHWVPVWERESYVLPRGAVAVYLDAGMAFGTGSHETTRLCAMRLVDILEETQTQNIQLVDAGCGSGILALSAYALGLRSITAFDIDPEVMPICRENMLFNEIPESSIEWCCAGLDDGLSHKSVDIVLANIQSNILMPHAHTLLHSINSGGSLVLSGILQKEITEVRECFEHEATTLWGRANWATQSNGLGDWADLYLVRSKD